MPRRKDGVLCTCWCGFEMTYSRLIHLMYFMSIVFFVMICATLATNSWMILRMGQGSKCFVGLFSYDCPTLGISGDFQKDSDCYKHSVGSAVPQIFAFVGLTIVFICLTLLEVHIWFGYKLVTRKRLIYSSFMSALFSWVCMLVSAAIYAGLAWYSCFSVVTDQTNSEKEPGYSYVATWLIWVFMTMWVPLFIVLEVYKPNRKGAALVGKKKKKKKGNSSDDQFQL